MSIRSLHEGHGDANHTATSAQAAVLVARSDRAESDLVKQQRWSTLLLFSAKDILDCHGGPAALQGALHCGKQEDIKSESRQTSKGHEHEHLGAPST